MKQYLSDVLPVVTVITVSYAVLEYLNHFVIMAVIVPWLLLAISIIAVSFLMASVVRTIKKIRSNVVTA